MRQDKGAGMTPDQITELITKGVRNGNAVSSIGVPNVMQRLRMYFAEPYGLHYTSEPGKFTRAEFCLPVVQSPEEIPDPGPALEERKDPS